MTSLAPSDLARKRCTTCAAGTAPLAEAVVRLTLADLPGWDLNGGEIVRAFKFKNYHETMAFVNAVAFISHREDHHPDLEVGYNACKVRYSTHSIGGISENDLICAVKVSALLEPTG